LPRSDARPQVLNPNRGVFLAKAPSAFKSGLFFLNSEVVLERMFHTRKQSHQPSMRRRRQSCRWYSLPNLMPGERRNELYGDFKARFCRLRLGHKRGRKTVSFLCPSGFRHFQLSHLEVLGDTLTHVVEQRFPPRLQRHIEPRSCKLPDEFLAHSGRGAQGWTITGSIQ
jgi:hypothetical protein